MEKKEETEEITAFSPKLRVSRSKARHMGETDQRDWVKSKDRKREAREPPAFTQSVKYKDNSEREDKMGSWLKLLVEAMLLFVCVSWSFTANRFCLREQEETSFLERFPLRDRCQEHYSTML